MSNEKPSFFKFLSNMDFTKLLRLPPAFVTGYESTLSEYVKLRVHSGRTWSVKVDRLRNGLVCFTEGWQFFARDVGLQLGDFLVFTLHKRSKFDVVIYGKSFCERVIPPSPHHSQPLNIIKNVVNNQVRNDVGSSTVYDPLYFEIRLKKHHRSRITLPSKFSVASGMKGRKQVMVEYLPSHDRKSVVVDHRQQTFLNRFDLSIGWNEFRKMSGLAWGNAYSFEFNPNLDLIYVNELRD